MTTFVRSHVAEARAGLALALSALVLAGCMVGPDYRRPDAPVAAEWKEGGGWKLASPGDRLSRDAWWSIYDDPVLDALEREAVAGNQDIVAAAARTREADALLAQARAGLLPAVGVGASAGRARSPQAGAGNTVGATIDASWEVDLWGRVRRAVEASEASRSAASADLESARLSITASLASAYFSVRVVDAGQRLLDRTVEAYGQTLALTTNRYQAGVVARADVVQAETQLKAAQAQAVDNRATRAQFEHAIAVLMGRPPAQFSLAVAGDLAAPPPIPPVLPSELLERRPDVAAAERRMAAANAEIGVATAAFFPTLSLSASGGYGASSFANLFSGSSLAWAIGANLAQPLFDAGLRRAQRDATVATFDEAVAGYRSTVLTGFQEVEDNLATLTYLAEMSQIQGDAVAAARRSLELTTNQYKAGIVGFVNVVTAQTTLFDNERTEVILRGRQWQANVALVKAIGGGWDASRLASGTPLAAGPASPEGKLATAP
jgi:NodT family efflux transporter outer membrane factor (OMF) lipoprotein